MDEEDVCHKGWRIAVSRRGTEWRAAVYRPGPAVREASVLVLRARSREKALARAVAFVEAKIQREAP